MHARGLLLLLFTVVMASGFKVVVFVGSSKSVAAPWEENVEDARLGSRVSRFVQDWIRENRPEYEVDVMDAREVS